MHRVVRAVGDGAFADAVVVAAGSSRRMGGRDKLEEQVAGRSVLRRSIEAMAAAASVRQVVVVTAGDRVRAVEEQAWLQRLGARVVAGGARRAESAIAGVRAAAADVVLVHDAARPLVPPALVDAVAAAAARVGAAVPVVPVVDAIARTDGERISGRVDRDGLVRAQTPQGARRDLLLEAHATVPDAADAADEAGLLAAAGVPVATVPGDPTNIKVTLPGDLDLVRALATPPGSFRTGFGSDVHAFGPGDGLRIGGITIADAPRLSGHSDGDAALHAIATALLGAASLGDLGRLFPAGAPETRGIDSRLLLGDVRARLEASGWIPVGVDLTITGARPHLGAERLDAIRAAVASVLEVGIEAVSVRASTGNLSGDEGAGRTIAATALVTIAPR